MGSNFSSSPSLCAKRKGCDPPVHSPKGLACRPGENGQIGPCSRGRPGHTMSCHPPLRGGLGDRGRRRGRGIRSDRTLMTGTTPKGTARHLRLGLGLAVPAALPFAPGVTRSEGLRLSAAAIAYAVGSWVFETIAARRPGFPARVLTPVLGLLAITVVIIAIPRTLEAGLVLFILGAAFTTYVGGLKLGLWLSAGAVSAAVVANFLAPESDQVDGATLVAFAVLLPLLVVIVDRLTAERRRTTAALARLHDVLGAVESQPDHAATLDSIAASIGQNVAATVAGVMLRDAESVSVAARATVPSTLTPSEVEWLTRVELEVGSASPLVGRVGRTALVVA